MARRKKPQIKGTDPSYDHSFERFRPVPNDMPPDVIVPGIKADQKSAEAVAATKTESTSREPATVIPVRKKPTAPRKQNEPKPKPAVVKKLKADTDVSQDSDRPEPIGDRQTTLDAAVKVSQAKQMVALEEKGLKMKDIVTLAGRRATERFVLSRKFIPKPEAERLPMKKGYHTSKRLPGSILDAMREEQDPLGISSDPAMVRGQFELLFWSCLDEVIKELKAKY